jgi:hypothetical protein
LRGEHLACLRECGLVTARPAREDLVNPRMPASSWLIRLLFSVHGRDPQQWHFLECRVSIDLTGDVVRTARGRTFSYHRPRSVATVASILPHR